MAARVPLTRQRVLDAAVALADRDGAGSLSMRKLAQELGVEAMSLYHHVANKEEILDGIVDVVFGEIEVPSGGSGWKAAVRERAISAREAFRRHPWAVGLMRSRPGPATLRQYDLILGVLREAGFSVEMASHASSVVDSYVYGFVMTEANLPFQTSDETAEVVGTIMSEFRPDQYPHLAEMGEYTMRPGYAYGSQFLFGLDVVLDGLDRAWSAARRDG